MCGICGFIDLGGSTVDDGLLARMTEALHHRGPDGAGRHVDGNVGLGHRRLSIIDVEGGGQPIGNEDGSIQVVFNGEIYNFIELRAELQAAGHSFKTQSDTEVIVHAYEQWGEDCVARFNGMFTFALWNAKLRELFLARDHLGIKPLYYATVGRHLIFASEIKSLLEHPGYKSQICVFMSPNSLLIELGDPRSGGSVHPMQAICQALSEVGVAFIPFRGRIIHSSSQMAIIDMSHVVEGVEKALAGSNRSQSIEPSAADTRIYKGAAARIRGQWLAVKSVLRLAKWRTQAVFDSIGRAPLL